VAIGRDTIELENIKVAVITTLSLFRHMDKTTNIKIESKMISNSSGDIPLQSTQVNNSQNLSKLSLCEI